MYAIRLERLTNFIAVLVIAISFSSFTLWLVNDWIKYPLFGVEIFTILSIYLVLIKCQLPNSLKNILKVRNFPGCVLNITTIVLASILFILNVLPLKLNLSIFPLLLAFICTSILSGYCLQTIFRLQRYFSHLEVLVISFVLSFIFSAFVTLVLLPVDASARSIVSSVLFIAVGIISFLRNRIHDKKGDNKDVEDKGANFSLSETVDILPILVSVSFYVMFFFFTYPNAALLPATDISRHYGAAITLIQSPDLYTQFSYILFHAFQDAVLMLSGTPQSIATFQTMLVTLNIFLPLTIYILAKRFLQDVDKRVPAIAVIFYTVLSNFAFIYYTQLSLIGTTVNQVQFLVADKAYNAITNFLQPFPFFVPLSVSFMMLMIVFLLLKVQNMSKSKFVILCTTLIFAMYLTHVTEAVIFVIFLALYSLVSKSKDLRFDDALLASLIGFGLVSLWSAYKLLFWPSSLRATPTSFTEFFSFIVPLALVGVSIIWRSKGLPRIKLNIQMRFPVGSKFYTVVSTLLALVYLFGFLTWFFIEDFKSSSLIGIGVVPWFIYPLLLGTVGLLGVLSLRYLGSSMPNSSLAIIIGAAGFMFLLGRIISYSSINYFILGYWEKRFVLLIFIFLALLAPIPLIRFADRIQSFRVSENRSAKLKNVPLAIMVSVIVFSGFSSMVLQTQYWFTSASKFALSDEEVEAVEYLKKVLEHDTHAFTIAPSSLSRHALTFAAPPYQFSQPQISVLSKYPDIPLLTLSAHNLDHAYLYMHSRDMDFLKREPHSWLMHHLIPMLPIVFSNNKVTIYNASHVSYPLPNSDSHALLPTKAYDDSWFFSYDAVSLSSKNYTVMYDKDPNALKSKTVILSFDPVNYVDYYDNFSSSSKKWEVIKGTWRYSHDGLHGGDKSQNLDNVILTPIKSAAANLTATSSFKIVDRDPQNVSYTSLIYSWTDPKTFEYGGIAIRDDIVYVSFVNVTNGKPVYDPPWPGLKTELKWKPNDRFNMTISLHDKSRELFLNGTEYLHKMYDIKIPGHIGLGYGRTQDVMFDYFRIKEKDNISLRDLREDYIAYASSGGHLFVLNSNGYGSIADYLFGTSSSGINRPVLNSEKSRTGFQNVTVTSQGNNDIFENKTVYESTATNTKIKLPTTNISSSQGQPPIVSTKVKVGNGEITYIDTHPILSSFFNNSISGESTYATLARVSKLIDLNQYESDPINFNDISAIFRKMTGKGERFELDSTSVIFPSDIDLLNITMPDLGGVAKIITLTHVTNLQGSSYDRVRLHSNNNGSLALAQGGGLYSALTIGNNNDFTALNASFINNAILTGITNQGSSDMKIFRFYNISDISIAMKAPIHLFIREPLVKIFKGNILFNELYSASLYPSTGVAGNDLGVVGNVSFSGLMSDSYTLANNFVLEGSTQRIPPLIQFNEFGSLIPSISLSKFYSVPSAVRVLSLIPFLVAAVFLLFIPDRKRLSV